MVKNLAPPSGDMHKARVEYAHLEGRPYVPGRVHCYALMRDLYRDNFGIELRDYAIPRDWNSNQLNLIELIHEREGFFKVPDWSIKTLRPGDVLCIAIHSRNPNHFAAFVGENLILHHPRDQLSRTEMLRDFWRMTTCYVLRHPAVPDLTPSHPETSIQELISARYRPQAEIKA